MQRPRGAAPSSSGGETSQTQSQGAQREEKRGGGRGRGRKEEGPGEETKDSMSAKNMIMQFLILQRKRKSVDETNEFQSDLFLCV